MRKHTVQVLTGLIFFCFLFSCRTNDDKSGDRNRQRGEPGERRPGNGPGRGNPGDDNPQRRGQDNAPRGDREEVIREDEEVQEDPRDGRRVPDEVARNARVPDSDFHTEKLLGEVFTASELREQMTFQRKKEDLLELLVKKYPGVEKKEEIGAGEFPLTGRILLFAAMVEDREALLRRIRYDENDELRPLGHSVIYTRNAPNTQFFNLVRELEMLAFSITPSKGAVIHTEYANTYTGGEEVFIDTVFAMAEATVNALYEKFFLNGDLTERLRPEKRDRILENKYPALKREAYSGACLENAMREIQAILFRTEGIVLDMRENLDQNVMMVVASYKESVCRTSLKPPRTRLSEAKQYIRENWTNEKLMEAIERADVFGRRLSNGEVFTRTRVRNVIEFGSLDEDEWSDMRLICIEHCGAIYFPE